MSNLQIRKYTIGYKKISNLNIQSTYTLRSRSVRFLNVKTGVKPLEELNRETLGHDISNLITRVSQRNILTYKIIRSICFVRQ